MVSYSVIGILLVASFVTTVYKLQFFFIYPSNFPAGSRDVVDEPSKYSMEFEDVKLLTPDGENLHLYIVLSKEMVSNITVLVLGPNAGNMGNSLPVAELLHDCGYNVVMLSYRGYGKSTGSPSEKGLKRDLDATFQYISEHPQLKQSSLCLYGRSLGGAVAIYGAASDPYKQIDGLIVENTFLSIPKLAPKVIPYISWITPFLTERWNSEGLIDRIDPELPVMFMSGTRDELIPPEMFERLFKLCSSNNKRIHRYNSAHNDTVLSPGYWNDVKEFLNEVKERRYSKRSI